MQQLCFISILAASMYPSPQGCHPAGCSDTKLLLNNWQLKQTKIRAADGKRMSKIKCYFHRTVPLFSPFPPISDVIENGKNSGDYTATMSGTGEEGSRNCTKLFS